MSYKEYGNHDHKAWWKHLETFSKSDRGWVGQAFGDDDCEIDAMLCLARGCKDREEAQNLCELSSNDAMLFLRNRAEEGGLVAIFWDVSSGGGKARLKWQGQKLSFSVEPIPPARSEYFWRGLPPKFTPIPAVLEVDETETSLIKVTVRMIVGIGRRRERIDAVIANPGQFRNSKDFDLTVMATC